MATSTKAKPRARGQMQAFDPQSLTLIRGYLRSRGNLRELALLETGIDAMLRSEDLLSLTVADVTDHRGGVRERIPAMQGKTRRPITVALTQRAREALAGYIKAAGKLADDDLFTPGHARYLPPPPSARPCEWAKIRTFFSWDP